MGRRALIFLDYARRKWWKLLPCTIVVLVVLIGAVEYGTSRPGFCGSCHIMNSYHESWAKSEHGKAGVTCVACHYMPGEQHTLKAKFKGLGQLFSYLGSGARMIEKAAFVNDASCTASGCHSMEENAEEGKWLTEKIDFASYSREDGSQATVPFVHKTHFTQKNWMAGQEKHCSICHRHETAENHIEVSQKVCNLCHFKNLALNEKQSKCSLCHEIPEKPFRDGASNNDGQLVTHKTLEERKVACAGCHLHHVRGTGVMKEERCLGCHENDQAIMKDVHDAEVMHELHVKAQTAHCFSCHETIEHGKAPDDYDQFDAALDDCKVCHAAAHHNKRLLISGTGGTGIDKPFPIKHHTVEMGCLACHIVDAVDAKGRTKKVATAGVCVNCHSEKERGLVDKWKSDVAEMLEEALEYESEAVKALELARGKVPEGAIKKAEQLLKDGQNNLGIVNAGGGVHNKKYSIMLMDLAIEFFEDASAEVEAQ